MATKSTNSKQNVIRDALLKYLDSNGEIANLRDYCESTTTEYKLADGACRALAAAQYTIIQNVSKSCLTLTQEAQDYLKDGSPEFRFLAHVPPEGKPLAELKAECGAFGNLGFGKCMKQRWIKQDKKTGLVTRNVEGDVADEVVELLSQISAASPEANATVISSKQVRELKKRKLVKEVKLTTLIVKKGPRFSTTFRRQVADLTRDMLDG